jgi:hypothetical protein
MLSGVVTGDFAIRVDAGCISSLGRRRSRVRRVDGCNSASRVTKEPVKNIVTIIIVTDNISVAVDSIRFCALIGCRPRTRCIEYRELAISAANKAVIDIVGIS